MESIITIATVLTMYFNAANDVNAPYLYNSDLEDGVIHKIEVYEQKADNQMCAKMEYRYEYDDQGRLTTREVVRWDSERQTWVNDVRHTYKYYKNGYNVETSKWDAARQTYDLPSESVKTYRMNAEKNDMYLVNSLLCLEPFEIFSDRLFA